MGLHFSGGEEDGALEREIDGLLRDAARDRAERLQHAFDAVFSSHAGRPVDEARDALVEFAAQRGWTWTDTEHLDAAARAVSDRTRLDFGPH